MIKTNKGATICSIISLTLSLVAIFITIIFYQTINQKELSPYKFDRFNQIIYKSDSSEVYRSLNVCNEYGLKSQVVGKFSRIDISEKNIDIYLKINKKESRIITIPTMKIIHGKF